ncbi:MAG: fructosamine kinase family protein [Mobiluncus porci]|uniref:Phosphotransferase n=1 Tax=Mobiluncus porci TaxID=2652278 RepID=A0A7K0K355_9ACTO|nr:fructosamine kinase family protein [Mobiluncus porci]MDD7541964.1 fructosamine kinase family protein [Mobiluncus porci]MDY5747586.1 fructosamine kinase family protein [Mobiluncus porci]MST49926.1 phosphotransferase [Mobiluncus porci]
MNHGEFIKRATNAELEYEAAGLNWLREAEPDGGAHIVAIRGLDGEGLHLDYLESTTPTEAAARAFGAALALTHAKGARCWGAAPDTWDSTRANKGKMPMSVVPLSEESTYSSFGEWLVAERLRPVAEASAMNGDLPATTAKRLEKVYHLLESGEFDTPQPPLVKTPAARLHGDLWAGNLMWTNQGITLIDPSAYGGHAETDLAECGLFGTPLMSEIYAGYNSVSPLAKGWEERVPLHRIYMLTLHLALFGAGYLSAVETILQRYV